MKIGIVTTWFERGAAYVSRQYRDLLEKGHDVFIYARGGEGSGQGDPAWDGSYVTWGSDRGPALATYVDRRDFLGWLRKTGVEAVFFNEQHFWLPVVWCHQQGIKTGAYVDYYTESTLQLFAAYDFLVCNTQRHFSAFEWHEQAFYIPWGTSVDTFKPSSFDPVDPGSVVFFHSAGMSPERKGTAQAIRAFAGVRGPARLVIHSQVHLQDALPDLQAHMREMSEAGRLQVIEKTVGAPGLYHLGDVYVYPTRLEGIGLTIAEALASGLPAIVPDQPPMNEFVPRDVGCGARVPVIRQYARADGYYWPQCLVDRDALTASMQEYVDARRELPSRKRCAYEHAVRNLNWASRKDAVCKAFEQSRLLRSPGKHEAIQAAVRYEYSRAGGKLDLWLHFPLLCQIGQTASQAAQTAKRPFSSLLRKIIR